MNCFSDWLFFFEFGWTHIISQSMFTSLEGIDHFLFILALCIGYTLKDWRNLLWAVTAFTLGHTLTLLLTVFGYIDFPREYVEFLIPFTIFLTALRQFFRPAQQGFDRTTYLLTIVFGFIHGMAFAYDFKLMFESGECLWAQVLVFNISLEAAQLGVVAFSLLLNMLAIHVASTPKRAWVRWSAGCIALIAIYLMVKGMGIIG